MSATYFNRTIELVHKREDGQDVFVGHIQRNVKEGNYRGGRFMVRYQKQERTAIKLDERRFKIYI